MSLEDWSLLKYIISSTKMQGEKENIGWAKNKNVDTHKRWLHGIYIIIDYW